MRADSPLNKGETNESEMLEQTVLIEQQEELNKLKFIGTRCVGAPRQNN